jgi:hypothetical protein
MRRWYCIRSSGVSRILKHARDLSDEVLCERWVENPYYLAARRSSSMGYPSIARPDEFAIPREKS